MGNAYQRITYSDQLIHDGAGNLIGIRNRKPNGADLLPVLPETLASPSGSSLIGFQQSPNKQEDKQ